MIETQGLRHRHPGGAEIGFADIAVPQGAALLVLGPSGAGKSTWLALLAGLLTPTAGRAVVAGQDVAALPQAARDGWRARTLALLPQRLHLSAALTVADNLALAYLAAGLAVDRAAIAAALAALDVAALAGSRPAQLSVGQAQRVALARALLLRPKVLLADEPTASLDDASAATALALLRQTALRLGATLVVATHDARVRDGLPWDFRHEIGFQTARNAVTQL